MCWGGQRMSLSQQPRYSACLLVVNTPFQRQGQQRTLRAVAYKLKRHVLAMLDEEGLGVERSVIGQVTQQLRAQLLCVCVCVCVCQAEVALCVSEDSAVYCVRMHVCVCAECVHGVCWFV